MKRLFFILSTLSLLSCQENETIEKRVDQETVHPDWTKLEIPGGRQALAIAGSIDDTLLVTTWTKAYYTTDQGETWQESKNFHGPIPGLYIHQDTILSLEAYLYEDAESPPKAALNQYYTIDFGKSWHYYPGDTHAYKQLIGVVASSSGTTYQIKHRRTPISEGASNF
ncbi:hypothetical protein WJR50_24075 [Catalinimonas sp. 4WD22]|uniref:hypothetical protein n=1 Tax=Catalinimonas locisalis TaxID=3133978 RepID=UPI0031016B2B